MSDDGCTGQTEVYSRVTGFYRPVQAWNPGKMAEFGARRTYAAKVLYEGPVCGLRVAGRLGAGLEMQDGDWLVIVEVPCALDPEGVHRGRWTLDRARELAGQLKTQGEAEAEYEWNDLEHPGAPDCRYVLGPEAAIQLSTAIGLMLDAAAEGERAAGPRCLECHGTGRVVRYVASPSPTDTIVTGACGVCGGSGRSQ